MFLRSAELRPSHAHAFFSRESGSTRVSTNNGRSSCLNHIHNVLPDHCMLLFQETPTHLTCTGNTVDISPIKAQVPIYLVDGNLISMQSPLLKLSCRFSRSPFVEFTFGPTEILMQFLRPCRGCKY